MEFYEIEFVKINCSKCKTSAIVPLSAESFQYSKEKDFQFQCPNCRDDLTELTNGARKCAIDYNKICKEAKDLKAHNCDFADIGGF